MSQQQIQNLLFVQQMNTHRLKMRQLLDQSQNVDSKQLKDIILRIQLLLYQNKDTIDVQKQLDRNTTNIMRMINWEHAYGENSNEGDDQKYNINFQDELSNFLQNQLNEGKTINMNNNMENKSERIQQVKPIIKEVQIKNAPNKIQDERNKPVEFVAASSLPKGTSIRKKFVPPFKKPQKEQNFKIKQPAGENKQSDDAMDPRYGNLQGKLVQIIQSQIVERDKKVQWSQIAGLGFAKKIIHEMIVWPMLRPDIFTGLRAPPKGILLFGPPGTGKTMIGRAIASQAHATFFSISASSITSKWVGESEKLVKTLFAIARAKQPSVIFIDEIDSLLCSRKQGEQQSSRRVKTQFLVELDGAKTSGDERVLIIGATNLPQQLDDAVRRRFVKRLYIPLPNFEGRKQLLNSLTSNNLFEMNEEQIDGVAEMTKGFSGADMYNLCSEASYVPLRTMLSSIQTIRTSEVPVIKFQHFVQALKLVKSSVNQTLLQDYENWNRQYGSYQLSPDQLQKQENHNNINKC